MRHRLFQGDCFDVLPQLPPESVDLILADPLYGVTKCRWDSQLDLDRLWAELRRIATPRCPVVFTATQPFTSLLILSNLKGFKCEWIWVKNKGSNFATVKYQPFKEHESICVFSLDGKALNYYPIKEGRKGGGKARTKYLVKASKTSECYGHLVPSDQGRIPELRYPSSVQKFNVQRGLHPTQKPVDLFEYLIKTYSLPKATILDFCMGSGTTGVAAVNTDRRFIGIEILSQYYQIACDRVIEAVKARPAPRSPSYFDRHNLPVPPRYRPNPKKAA